MNPSSTPAHVDRAAPQASMGCSPAQAGSRCLEDPEERIGHTVARSEPVSNERPQVVYFLSGVLV